MSRADLVRAAALVARITESPVGSRRKAVEALDPDDLAEAIDTLLKAVADLQRDLTAHRYALYGIRNSASKIVAAVDHTVRTGR